MMDRKGFLLESYRGTVQFVLQPKKPLRESLQASTFSAEILWKWRHLFLNNLSGKKNTFSVRGCVHFEEKGPIIPPAGSGRLGVHSQWGGGKNRKKKDILVV